MLFNSYAFLVFLPLVFCLYWPMPRKAQNLLLLAASYVFYGWWDARFLTLIVMSSAVDYVAGARIAVGRRRRVWFAISLSTNLGALAVFKYLDFGIESLAASLRALGFQPHLPVLHIVLPVGISFYTFQTLSYSIDVYRRQIAPTRDVVAFFAFVAFFPQLVAGPIERANRLLPQFLEERRFDADLAADGLRQMLYGLFLKMVVADNMAPLVNAAYGDPGSAGGATLLWATWAFAFQIYSDFAGYSHIALGCARLFGFSLSRNFAYPYFARSPAEFWHRWHITLSTWFRDYVYIPLGGSRCGGARRSLNVLATFVTSGVWHGAGMTFAAWGLFHGLLVRLQWWAPETVLEAPAGRALLPRLRDAAAIFVTFQMVCIGWVFFRAGSLAEAGQVLAAVARDLAGGRFLVLPDPRWGWIPVLLAIEWLQRGRPHGLCLGSLGRLPRRLVCYTTAAAIVLASPTEQVPFIYFQF